MLIHHVINAGFSPFDSDFVGIVNGYFDESGKFKDQKVVSFSGVIARSHQIEKFERQWRRLLRQNGLQFLTMKDAMRMNRPLSNKNPAMTRDARLRSLLPFAKCVREHFEIVVIQAIDVQAFLAMSDHSKQLLGNDPHFTAVGIAILQVLDGLLDGNFLSLICDDEESTAEPVYKFYRKIKLRYPKAKTMLSSLTFADDEVYAPLQAADMVASLARHEATRRFFNQDYPFTALYDCISAPHDYYRSASLVGFWKDEFMELSSEFDVLRNKFGRDMESFTS